MNRAKWRRSSGHVCIQPTNLGHGRGRLCGASGGRLGSGRWCGGGGLNSGSSRRRRGYRSCVKAGGGCDNGVNVFVPMDCSSRPEPINCDVQTNCLPACSPAQHHPPGTTGSTGASSTGASTGAGASAGAATAAGTAALTGAGATAAFAAGAGTGCGSAAATTAGAAAGLGAGAGTGAALK
jgi:hypothetical protein